MYKSAVIGLGFIGAADQVSGDALGQQVVNLDGTHAQALAEHDQVELIAGSSRDEGRRKRFAERMNVKNTYAEKKLLWDAENMKITNSDEANKSPFMKRLAPRDDMNWI